MKNLDLVKTTLQILKKLDVSDVIVCAGARNAPLVHGLEHENFKVISYFEERSAAFYGLGKIQQSQKPIAIVTTSGTAVAELFPAVIESYYQNKPLILITADRPKHYRGSGAPQAIDQAGFFQNYVESAYDWDVEQKDFNISFSGTKPFHFNLCFDEPLIDGEYARAETFPFQVQKTQLKTTNAAVNCQNPLVIVSEIKASDRKTVVDFLKHNKLFFYSEFLSGLMNHEELKSQQLVHLEGFQNLKDKYNFNSIIRIGGVPTHRLWRDLEGKYRDLPVFSFSDRNFSGLARESQIYSLANLQNVKIEHGQNFSNEIVVNHEQELKKFKDSALVKHKNSEPAFVAELSKVIQNDPLYIGNSLPIREWDLFSTTSQKNQNVLANRGANGIDGQISTYLGWSALQSRTWCLIGDLTALYDLAALGLGDTESQAQKRIVIMNNSGGKIFNRLFKDKKYLNPQAVNFAGWAQLWGWNYLLITDVKDFEKLKSLTAPRVIIELQPDNAQSDQFWHDWDQQCRQ